MCIIRIEYGILYNTVLCIVIPCTDDDDSDDDMEEATERALRASADPLPISAGEWQGSV